MIKLFYEQMLPRLGVIKPRRDIPVLNDGVFDQSIAASERFHDEVLAHRFGTKLPGRIETNDRSLGRHN